MNKSQRLLFILLIIFVHTTNIAAGQIVVAPNQDTLGIRSQIDSAYSLRNKNFKSAQKLFAPALIKARTSNSNELLQYALYKGAQLDWSDGLHSQALLKTDEYLYLIKLMTHFFICYRIWPLFPYRSFLSY